MQQVENLMLLSELRAQWAHLRVRIQNVSHEVMVPTASGYATGKRQPLDGDDVATAMVRSEDMLKVFTTRPVVLIEEQSTSFLQATLSPELIARSIGEFYSATVLHRRWVLTESDWLHSGLLQKQAPSQYDFDKINSKLKEWVRVGPNAQETLLQTFLRYCEGYPEPWLTLIQANKIINRWIDQETLEQFDEVDGDDDMGPTQRLQKLLEDSEFQNQDRFTYYEFLLHMLGCGKSRVQIYMFDISKGHARWLSPALVGEEVSGIWHTSVVAFGLEYWFGSSIYVTDPPGSSPWGKPTLVHDMPGWTLRSPKELRYFIQTRLAFRFTQQRYDILTNNCNNFSDGVCTFLLNSHLPEQILQQPDLMLGEQGTPLQVLRPLLNTVLGGFEAKDSNELPIDPDFAAHAEKERSLLIPNSFVLWEYCQGWRRCAMLLLISESEIDTCEIQWLDIRTGSVRIEKTTLSKLKPAKPLTSNADVAIMGLSRSAEIIFANESTKIKKPPSLPCDTRQVPQPKRRVQPLQHLDSI